MVLRNSSPRSPTQRTGLAVARAAQAMTTSSGYEPVFMPKPPPTSPTRTRTSSGLRPSAVAMAPRTAVGICELACTSSRAPSHAARSARGSSVSAARRWCVMFSLTMCAAWSNAACAAAASPWRASQAMLSGAASVTAASAASAAASVGTAGNSS